MRDLSFYGKNKKTNFDFDDLSDEEYVRIKNEFYKKPSVDDVKLNIYRVARRGDNNLSDITKYYFSDLMYDCTHWDTTYSINQILGNKILTSFAYFYINKNKKFFYDGGKDGDSEALRRMFALGRGTIGGSVAQFPLKTVRYILSKYNVNNNWYDYSCGWGSRLSGAPALGINYFGTDPNYLLVDKLNELICDWKTEVPVKSSANIYCQGSEEFIPEMENRIGLAFSSPPYFGLEDYKHGNQSNNRSSYSEWIDTYLRPTFENIYKYLIDDGIFICNIKNYNKYTLEEDTVKTAEECGFIFRRIDDLNLNMGQNRPSGVTGELITTSEPMFIFTKRNDVVIDRNIKISLW